MTSPLGLPRAARQAVTDHSVTRTGPVLVLAHGFGCDQGMWDLVVPRLMDRFRVITFDHVGAGRSDLNAYDPHRHAQLEGYAQDLADLLAEQELDEVVLVGHSVSAMIATLTYQLAPQRFHAIVMVGPSPRYTDAEGYRGGFSESDVHALLETLEANFLGWSASMAPVIMGNGERPELGQRLERSFCRMDPTIAAQFARATFLSDHRDVLPHVHAPTLVLQCREDAIAPEAVGRYVAAALPRSTFQLLDAVGHCPHVSAPQETADAIVAFLATLSP